MFKFSNFILHYGNLEDRVKRMESSLLIGGLWMKMDYLENTNLGNLQIDWTF